jgi:hypothetical protein
VPLEPLEAVRVVDEQYDPAVLTVTAVGKAFTVTSTLVEEQEMLSTMWFTVAVLPVVQTPA